MYELIFIKKMLYMCYIDNLDVIIKQGYPIMSSYVSKSNKYPLIWIGKSSKIESDLQTILYDKRSCYNRYKNKTRFFCEYMLLFKYLEDHPGNFKIKIHKLSDDDTQLFKLKLLYRLFYGNNLLLDDTFIDTTHNFITKMSKSDDLKNFPDLPPVVEPVVESVVEPVIDSVVESVVKPVVELKLLSLQERHRISQKKWQTTNKLKVNGKCARYYQRNKDRLKEKRDALKLVLN